MTAKASSVPLSSLDMDPTSWSDEQINSHPLVDACWEDISNSQMEEARLVQLEQQRRFRARGRLPEYAFDMGDVDVVIEILSDPKEFARVCAYCRWDAVQPSDPVELPPGSSTFTEAGDAWFVGDD